MDNSQRSCTRAPILIGLLMAAVLAMLALSGCGAEQAAETPTPTKTQMPTFTPAPPSATPTEVPPTATATLPPTPTAAPTVAPTETPAPEPTAAPPTATRRPAAARPTARPVQPTSPPAAADPCANIDEDGCKWRKTGGASFGDNGGLELKLQFLFIHSGVAGGQPQQDYRVVLFKNGQRIAGPENGRSQLASSEGPKGKYNYEYVLGLDKLPDGQVTGSYSLYVEDGNGKRDSQDIQFEVPANSGLVWIQFDQNR